MEPMIGTRMVCRWVLSATCTTSLGSARQPLAKGRYRALQALDCLIGTPLTYRTSMAYSSPCGFHRD
jgi:hypothetical protein